MSESADPAAGRAEGDGGGRGGHHADRAIAALVAAGATVATAESLTGGLVAAALTSVPGASSVVLGGVVAYDAAVKRAVLGVDAELLRRGGAVQAEVARQMAVGVRSVCGAQWGVATTGVAGPDPADGQPVGTVFVGISGPEGDVVVPLTLRGNREAIRAETVCVCLDQLTERVAAHVVGANRYR